MSDDSKIQELEERVRVLEAQVNKLSSHSSNVYLQGKPQLNNQQIQRTGPQIPNPPYESKDPVDWERLIGQVWLPRIFIFVLLLGVIWGFKAASDVGVLNEGVRCIIGFIAGFGLIMLGEYQIKRTRVALGQVLLGGSITVLVVSTFATHVLYGFVGTTLAFTLNLIWIALGIFFAIRHRSEVLAILSTVGGYLVPFLLDSETGNTLFFVSYETIFSIGMLIFAFKKNYWKLHIVAAALLPIVFAIYSVFTIFEDEIAIVTYGIYVQHLTLLGIFFIKKSYFKSQQMVLSLSFLASVGYTYLGFGNEQIPWVLLGFGVMYLFINGYLHVRHHLKESKVVFPIALLAFLFYFMEVFGGRELGMVLMLQGTLAIYLGFTTKLKTQQFSGAFVYIIGALNTVGLRMEVFNSIPTWGWTTFVATLWLLTYLTRRDKDVIPSEIRNILFGSTAVAVLVYISQLSHVFTKDESINSQYLAMTIAWIVYAICGAVYGVIKNNRSVRILGIALIFLSLGKLIFIDLPNVSIVVRAVLFMIVGATGVIISRFFYK
ncbi:DUF2339 domain-containing protein [Pseudalkalibacillus decolorationis]|uniref:DUF2339 domain-containing protein n=1 Tax=Pseudalkalibacillus decolorationis TaxID=163879 RepID=UPI0021479D45|nr:DUF2339 domain-containing protein [Pseudalkalibacillus decolorationis]